MDVVLGAHNLRMEEPSQQKLSVIRQFTNSYDPEQKLNDILILEVGGHLAGHGQLAGAASQARAHARHGLLGRAAPGLPPGAQSSPFSARGPPSPDSGFAISSPSTICLSPPLGPSQTRKISPWRAEVGSQGLAEDGVCSWHPICAL